MARRIVVLVEGRANASMLTEVGASDEHQLQETMKRNPDLLPIDEFNMTGPLLVVGRETTLPSGSVDLVALARGGELLVVELKTGPNNPDFRAVLAQLLDYGSDLWGMSLEQFEQTVAVRYFASAYCGDARFKNLPSLDAAIQVQWPDIGDDEKASLRESLISQLRQGSFHYLAVAQRFSAPVQKTVDYMNVLAPSARFYAVEMVRFAADGIEAFESRTFVKPRSGSGPGTTSGKSITEQRFLDAVADPAYRDLLADFIEFLKGLGLPLHWGAAGFSFKVKPPDGGTPLSIGWLFPPGAWGWMSLTDLNFGFDPSSADSKPLLRPALDRYLDELRALKGSSPVTTGGLKAQHISPETAHALIPQVKDIIGRTVAAINGIGAATG